MPTISVAFLIPQPTRGSQSEIWANSMADSCRDIYPLIKHGNGQVMTIHHLWMIFPLNPHSNEDSPLPRLITGQYLRRSMEIEQVECCGQFLFPIYSGS